MFLRHLLLEAMEKSRVRWPRLKAKPDERSPPARFINAHSGITARNTNLLVGGGENPICAGSFMPREAKRQRDAGSQYDRYWKQESNQGNAYKEDRHSRKSEKGSRKASTHHDL